MQPLSNQLVVLTKGVSASMFVRGQINNLTEDLDSDIEEIEVTTGWNLDVEREGSG